MWLVVALRLLLHVPHHPLRLLRAAGEPEGYYLGFVYPTPGVKSPGA